MAWLEKYQSLYMDVLVSASLFALLHISEKQNESVGYPNVLHFLLNLLDWFVLTFVMK